MNQVVIDLTVILFANVVLEKRRKKRIRRISNITKKLQKISAKTLLANIPNLLEGLCCDSRKEAEGI